MNKKIGSATAPASLAGSQPVPSASGGVFGPPCAWSSDGLMRSSSYTKRAARRFLQGTRYRAPVDLVEGGGATLEAWCEVLEEEREIERETKTREAQERARVV